MHGGLGVETVPDSDTISTATDWPVQSSYVTCGKEQKWEEFGINEQKGQKGGNVEKWGHRRGHLLCKLSSSGKIQGGKANPSNVRLDTGGIKTSRLERSMRKRRGGRKRRHRSTDFFYLHHRHLFRACGGALILQIWPLLSAWSYSDLTVTTTEAAEGGISSATWSRASQYRPEQSWPQTKK